MSPNVFHPGIGRLLPGRGPDGLRLWSVAQAPRSALYGAPVEATILLEGTDDLDRADLALVGEVLGAIDRYLAAGLRFVREALAADPAFFGLTEAESEPYLGLPETDFPLDSPQLNFHLDEWHLHFAQGRLPICDPYGLAVVFDGQRPVRVEDLSDATALDDAAADGADGDDDPERRDS
ncbi:hypothetical protein ABZW03_18015 [Kitasatospora sp. NPDC004799]|uniref:hypothetical protein n=1 Tax=Kitasatospora sp. NPDC004799 TaxID=3154460 RepID=UPI0033B59BC0